ncbi:MAG: Flp pilus assembly complex ATPase component TadA [Lachnospiraceae bacterium]|nr:Flp pilus assembly complex ATPase component TadA [Lachnospiraceae bacterium]
MDFRRKKLRIGDILVTEGVLTEEKLQEALENKGGKKLGEYLVESGTVGEDAIVFALSHQLGYPTIDLANVEIDQTLLDMFKGDQLKKIKVFPFGIDEAMGNVQIAMSDPLDINAQDDIAIITNMNVQVFVSTEREILMQIDKNYGQSDVSSALDEYAKEKNLGEKDATEQDNGVSNSPVVVMVKEMIDNAVRQRASDIHLEPLESRIRVRYRIDGACHERGSYNINVLPAVIARIKIIGGMDISEKRKPQDGRITQIVDRVEYDIRVSILPTVYGEKVVMRLTAKMALTREKSQLGLKPYEMKRFDWILAHPNGILLVTGPTGSGKSTTLYTALSELNKEDVNIITVEDPVEANIDGINQVHVNVKAGLTFASALRSILRQDPDIIMIGEIRDEETARIAVQASITGHLVVSTLHTNSSASTITRLEDMGIESYLIADSVIGVIAQRLVRRLCPECKQAKLANEEELRMMDLIPDSEVTIYEPVGCPKCDNTGYRGRIGVYEIMVVTEELKRVISKKMGAAAIKEQALKDGMKTLHMGGTDYVLEGVTSFSEMARISFDS